MKITSVKIQENTTLTHDIIEFKTDKGSRYFLMDYEIETLLDENGELQDIDREKEKKEKEKA